MPPRPFPESPLAPAAQTPLPETKPLALHQRVDKLLLREFTPATVVVNSHMDVVHFRGRTGLFLEHAPGSATLNLFNMVRDTLGLTVRAALSKALRQDGPVKHAGIEFVQEGRLYDLTLEVVPFRMEPFHEQYFLVVFRENERLREGKKAQQNRPFRGQPRVRLTLLALRKGTKPARRRATTSTT